MAFKPSMSAVTSNSGRCFFSFLGILDHSLCLLFIFYNIIFPLCYCPSYYGSVVGCFPFIHDAWAIILSFLNWSGLADRDRFLSTY